MSRTKLMILDLLHDAERKETALTLEDILKHIPEQIQDSEATISYIRNIMKKLQQGKVITKTANGYVLK